MTRMKFITGVAIFLCGTLVSAQPPAGDLQQKRMPAILPFGPHGGPHGNMENALPVTLDIAEFQKQLTEIGVVKETTENAVAVVRTFLAEFEKQLILVQREELNIKEELLKEKPDLKVIQGFVTKKAQLFSTIEFAQIKRDLEIKSLLTRDEFERWKSEMKVRIHRMMPSEMHGNRNGPEESPPVPKK